MRICTLALFLCPLSLFAEPSRRLSVVRYNIPDNRICWDVQVGSWTGEGSKTFKLERLEEEMCIDMSEASMTVASETRWFSKEESQRVQRLLNLLAKYAAESTVWWEQGEGERQKPGTRQKKTVRAARVKR